MFDTEEVSNQKAKHEKLPNRRVRCKEEKILAYKDWTLYVTTAKNRRYLAARKYDKERRKMIRKSLGFLDDEALEIIRKYALKVKGLTD